MGFSDALWHLLNLFAAAAGLAAIASAITKLLWFGELRAVPWWRLWAWSAATSALISLAGLVYFGRDGKMATYAAMAVASALVLWCVAFGPGRR